MMKNQPTSTQALHPASLVSGLLAVMLAGCATTVFEAPPVPKAPALEAAIVLPAVQAPAGELPLMTVAANGVQIYECRITQGTNPAWTFVAPEADLFDAQGRRIGSHGAGPFWQHADGSRFVGTVSARADAPRPGAIPWLLLAARQQGPEGMFSTVRSVQRVNTVGGQAPVEGCSVAALGKRALVAYRADYVLYAPPI
jgi:Protein of unknown function (DUF3455)